MKSNKVTLSIIFLVILITNLLIIFYSNIFPNINLHCSLININSSAIDIISSNPTCDTSSNLNTAINLFNGPLTDTTVESLNNWPIGMPILLKVFLTLERFGLPLILIFGFFISILVAGTLTNFINFGISNKKTILGIFFCLLFLLSSPNEGWISGTGLLYPEGIAILAILIALFKIVSLDQLNKLSTWNYFLIASCIAIAAYFRAIFELQLNILIFTSIIFLLFAKINFFQNKFSIFSQFNLIKIKTIFKILIISFFMLIPWRIAAEHYVHPGNFGWTSAYDKWWISWIPTERLSEFNISFDSAQGGINMACELNPLACQEFQIPTDFRDPGNIEKYNDIYFQTYIESIIRNPIKYLDLRLSIIRNFWMQDNEFNYLRNWNFTEGYFFLIILFVSIILAVWTYKKFLLTSFFYLISISLQFLVLLLHHVEARYFIGIKIMSLSYVYLMLVLLLSKQKISKPKKWF